MTKKDIVSDLPKIGLIGMITSDNPDSIKVDDFQTVDYHQEGPFYLVRMRYNPYGER